MSGEPLDHTQELLRRLRDEMHQEFAALRGDLASLKDTVQFSARSDVSIQRSLTAMQLDVVALKHRINILTVAIAGDDDPHTHVSDLHSIGEIRFESR